MKASSSTKKKNDAYRRLAINYPESSKNTSPSSTETPLTKSTMLSSTLSLLARIFLSIQEIILSFFPILRTSGQERDCDKQLVLFRQEAQIDNEKLESNTESEEEEDEDEVCCDDCSSECEGDCCEDHYYQDGYFEVFYYVADTQMFSHPNRFDHDYDYNYDECAYDPHSRSCSPPSPAKRVNHIDEYDFDSYYDYWSSFPPTDG